jgi:putative oxidoreductase
MSETSMNEGLLVVRLVFGALLASHGSQKLFGWFGGAGLGGTAAFFEGLRFRPGRLFAVLVGLTECAAGASFMLGLLQPAAAGAVISVMTVAILTVHWKNGLLSATNGIELPLLYAATAVSLALTGPGQFSIDALFGLSAWFTPELTSIVLALGFIGGFAALAWRERATVVMPSRRAA